MTEQQPPAIGPTVHAVTVLGAVEEVRRAWEGGAVDTTDVDTEVVFRPATGDKGTEVIVRPEDPGAARGGLVDRIRGDAPHQRIRARLREFKSVFETGEVITTEGQPTGRSSAKESVTKAITEHLREWGAA